MIEKGGAKMRSRVKWIWFAEKCGAGSSEMMTVLDKFGSIEETYLADYDDYLNNDVSEHLAQSLSDKSLDRACDIIKACEMSGIGILTYSCEEYPKSLRALKDPPAVLYYVGKLPDFNKKLCIATVGTRKMSEYGMRTAYKIAYEIASAGAVVVSGMALGIDSTAACAALAAGGITVAVLGSGIDVVYPREHKRLYDAIKQRGAILSEYPPSVEPNGFHFPMRNRIISGLSQGTVVIDASVNSGALITSKTAILQGRDIYAVPSNIDSENSSGTNSLIRDGAQAVLCGNDIIKNYTYLFRDSLDIQKMKNSEKHSGFDGAVPASFGVRARGKSPAYGGVCAPSRVRTDRPHEQKSEKTYSLHEQKAEKTHSPAQVNGSVRQSDGDNSRALFDSLNEKQRMIFDELPLDRAVPADYLINAGFAMKDVFSALTVLEVKGLISSLPGGLYQRK